MRQGTDVSGPSSLLFVRSETDNVCPTATQVSLQGYIKLIYRIQTFRCFRCCRKKRDGRAFVEFARLRKLTGMAKQTYPSFLKYTLLTRIADGDGVGSADPSPSVRDANKNMLFSYLSESLRISRPRCGDSGGRAIVSNKDSPCSRCPNGRETLVHLCKYVKISDVT